KDPEKYLCFSRATCLPSTCRMREVEVAGHPVLLVRDHLQFSALGSRCTHAGAPLSKGYLGQGRIRCPWHGACFSLKTGDIEEYPTLDSAGLPSSLKALRQAVEGMTSSGPFNPRRGLDSLPEIPESHCCRSE
uniref:Rieske domain-containing protein n=1 Tax=Podarcis muralis TaxID=64176 RepID=A0A670K4X2_PODMU